MLFPFLSLLVLYARLTSADTTIYDRYTGEPASKEQLAKYEAANITETCAIPIEDCDATERRRVDGSCNNLDNPAKGTLFEPVYRFLPAAYGNGYEPRKAFDGSDLELPRTIRQALISVGTSIGQEFTQAWTSYQIFIFQEFASIHDLQKTLQIDCCAKENINKYECAPTIVLPDDPVHRFSGVRCVNMTRPILYSDFGCTDDPVPSPIQRSTSGMDMSFIYNALGEGDKVVRSFKDGKLAVDIDENGIVWPPNGPNFCLANQPDEPRCFGKYSTALLQTSLLSVWWMRQHNYVAEKLREVNPCWDDERLFQETREIIIGLAAQLYYYQYLPTVIGRENLIKAGVISSDCGHRDIYDASMFPETSLEYTYAIRWFHTCQQGFANMYYPDGTYMKSFPLVNATFRPGLLGVDKNMVYFTQHMFRQASGEIGPRMHPDLAEMGQGLIQYAFDIPSNDLHRGRYLGFAPYIDYVEKCTGHTIKSFDDLREHIEPGKILQLKQMYKHPRDIELLAGLWVEKLIKGGSVSATLACIMTDFTKRVVQSDRHWYERADRPYAFTKEQLLEIRKFSLPHLMCTCADEVSEIQSDPFYVISPENPLKSCSEYDNIDYTKWADATCSASSNSGNENESSSSWSKSKYDDSEFEKRRDHKQEEYKAHNKRIKEHLASKYASREKHHY